MLQADKLEAVADRGYFNGEEILACEQAGITVTLPKPMTSGAKSEGRFGKQDFVYLPEEDVYRCPAGEKLTYLLHQRGERPEAAPLLDERVPDLRRSRRSARQAPQRRITRWEHEHVLEAVQKRLDKNPRAMRHAARDGRASVRHAQDADGRDALPDEDAAEGRHRDGAARARLQSDARHEHRRHQAADGGDQGVSAETPLRADLGPDLAQHPHDNSEAVPDRPTGKNCSDWPCRTTLTGSWTVAGCVSALSRNQDPWRKSASAPRRVLVVSNSGPHHCQTPDVHSADRMPRGSIARFEASSRSRRANTNVH